METFLTPGQNRRDCTVTFMYVLNKFAAINTPRLSPLLYH